MNVFINWLKESFWGLVFVFLFVLQQEISETYRPASLVDPYWIVVYLLFIVLGLFVMSKYPKNTKAFSFTAIICICTILTFLNGESPGMVLVKILNIIIAYIGLLYVSNKRIRLWIFDILLLLTYLYFYRMYFGIMDSMERKDLDAYVFIQSSVNSIPICLNTILSIYIFLNSFYEAKRERIILAFSVVNFILCIMAQGRIGVFASFLFVLMSIYEYFKSRVKTISFKWYFIVIPLVLIIIYGRYSGIINDYLENIGILRAFYEAGDEGRVVYIREMFNQMDFGHFLCGFSHETRFLDDHRTYMTLLDFWMYYGLIPEILLIVYCIKRLINRRYYNIPLYYFVPIFIYSFFESYLAGNLWFFYVYCALFLKKPLPAVNRQA